MKLIFGLGSSLRKDIALKSAQGKPKNWGGQNHLQVTEATFNKFNKILGMPALLGNERKGRYVALLCHDSLIFKGLINQELRQR
nr:hypothetical protein [uncultured Mucilaginibacter sp.]